MTAERTEHIRYLRASGFNCFPIPAGTKKADHRYKAAKTLPNQPVGDDENYGYIPIAGSGNCILDFDDKERFRDFAEKNIENGVMVIETPHGWHIPVTNLGGNISKTELFDYRQQSKKILEIQGSDHYCVGPGSAVDGISYKINNDRFWDAKQMDFHSLVDHLCDKFTLTGRKKSSNSSYGYMRERFQKEIPPSKGTSNDYFFQAAIQCNTDGDSEAEAMERIRKVYDDWTTTPDYSDRPWSNIEAKIREVYEKDIKAKHGGSSGKKPKRLDRVEIVEDILSKRTLYSVPDSEFVYENKHGFLEKINGTLRKDLIGPYPEMEKEDYNSILFKLASHAKNIPDTDKDLVVFRNGVFDRKSRQLVETEAIADMGFKDYDYIPPGEGRRPERFMRILFENVDEAEVPRIKAGLKAALSRRLDSRISVIHGRSTTGKSAPLQILAGCMGEYAMVVELDQFLDDHFIKAKIENKSLLVLQDLPKTWKNFAALKAVTGEITKTERGFQSDMKSFDVKLKIWASANYLPKIPAEEKDAMFTRRLSLVQNRRQKPYEVDDQFEENIIRDEGEAIISWILNIPDSECEYETSSTVQANWDRIASPEIEFIASRWEVCNDKDDPSKLTYFSAIEIKNEYQVFSGNDIDIKSIKNSMINMGFVLNRFNLVENIKKRPIPITPVVSEGQQKL